MIENCFANIIFLFKNYMALISVDSAVAKILGPKISNSCENLLQVLWKYTTSKRKLQGLK